MNYNQKVITKLCAGDVNKKPYVNYYENIIDNYRLEILIKINICIWYWFMLYPDDLVIRMLKLGLNFYSKIFLINYFF